MGCLFPVVLHGRVVLSLHGAIGRGNLAASFSCSSLVVVHNAHVGDRPVGHSTFGGLLLRQSVGLFSSCQLVRVAVVDASVASVVFLLSVFAFAVGSSCLCLPTAFLAIVLSHAFAQSWFALDVGPSWCVRQ